MIDGSDKILYIYETVGAEWLPIGCLISNSFSENVEMLDATMRSDTDGWTQSTPSFQSYTISFDGIITLDDRGGTIINYEDIVALKRARTKIQWRITSGEGEAEEGYGYFVSLSDSASIGEFVTFSGQIQGVGSITSTAWTPPSLDSLDSMIPPYEAAQG